MTLKEQLENSLKDAMRAGDNLRKQTIRMVLSGIKLAEIERGKALSDDEIIAILQKEIKSRHEAASEGQKANRPDLVEAAGQEILILETYLPQQMSEEELTNLIKAAILEVNASAPSDMGKVMKVLLPKVKGRASGDQVSQIVRRLLQG